MVWFTVRVAAGRQGCRRRPPRRRMRLPVVRTRPSPASRPPPPRRFRPYPARNQQPRVSGPSHPPRAQGNCRTTIFDGLGAAAANAGLGVRGAGAAAEPDTSTDLTSGGPDFCSQVAIKEGSCRPQPGSMGPRPRCRTVSRSWLGLLNIPLCSGCTSQRRGTGRSPAGTLPVFGRIGQNSCRKQLCSTHSLECTVSLFGRSHSSCRMPPCSTHWLDCTMVFARIGQNSCRKQLCSTHWSECTVSLFGRIGQNSCRMPPCSTHWSECKLPPYPHIRPPCTYHPSCTSSRRRSSSRRARSSRPNTRPYSGCRSLPPGIDPSASGTSPPCPHMSRSCTCHPLCTCPRRRRLSRWPFAQELGKHLSPYCTRLPCGTGRPCTPPDCFPYTPPLCRYPSGCRHSRRCRLSRLSLDSTRSCWSQAYIAGIGWPDLSHHWRSTRRRSGQSDSFP